MSEDAQSNPDIGALQGEVLQGLPEEVRRETMEWIGRASSAPAAQVERELLAAAGSCHERFSRAAAALERLIVP